MSGSRENKMTLTSAIRRKLITLIVPCALFSIPATPVFADSGIKIHKANQFHSLSKTQPDDRKKLIHFLNKHHSHRKPLAKSQQPPVLDSRFPNSYRAYSDYQKKQAQKYGQH